MPVIAHTNRDQAAEALAKSSMTADAAIRAVFDDDPGAARRAIADARALLAVADTRLAQYAAPPA